MEDMEAPYNSTVVDTFTVKVQDIIELDGEDWYVYGTDNITKFTPFLLYTNRDDGLWVTEYEEGQTSVSEYSNIWFKYPTSVGDNHNLELEYYDWNMTTVETDVDIEVLGKKYNCYHYTQIIADEQTEYYLKKGVGIVMMKKSFPILDNDGKIIKWQWRYDKLVSYKIK